LAAQRVVPPAGDVRRPDAVTFLVSDSRDGDAHGLYRETVGAGHVPQLFNLSTYQRADSPATPASERNDRAMTQPSGLGQSGRGQLRAAEIEGEDDEGGGPGFPFHVRQRTRFRVQKL